MRKQRNLVLERLGVTAISVTLALCISAAVCIFAPVSYRSSALVLVRSTQYVGADSNATATSFDVQQQNLNSLIELLLSRQVVEGAVDNFGPKRLYPFIGRSMDDLSSLAHEMRTVYNAWALGQSTAPLDDEPLRQKAVIRARRALDVSAGFKSNVISVSFSHPDPKVAADFTNELLSAFRSRDGALHTLGCQ